MNRRFMIAGLAVASAAPALIYQSRNSFAAVPQVGPMADPAGVKTAAEYFKAVLPRAELSLATSQAAVAKTAHKDAKEFAGFELGEAITVNMVIKDMDIVSPDLGDDAMMLVSKMKEMGEGTEFDRAYIAFQLANHEYLRNLAEGYLNNTVATTDKEQKHGRHMASLMAAVFKEHVAICKRISRELGA